MNGGKNLEEFTTETTKGRGAFHPSKKTGVSLMARDGLMNTIFYSEKQANGAVCNSDTNGGAFHGGKTPNDYTGMPPDGGSASDPNDPFNSALEPHAHSNHPGGVNAAFGDAHVGFYNNNVNLTHWQALTPPMVERLSSPVANSAFGSIFDREQRTRPSAGPFFYDPRNQFANSATTRSPTWLVLWPIFPAD